jgi:hypothetical protein
VQLPWTIVQNVVHPSDIPIVTAFVTFIQTLGATISLAISQNVFHAFLTKNIQSRVPSVNPAMVDDAGSTDVTKNIPSNVVSAVLHAYNEAIMETFYVSIAFAGLAVLGTLVLEWRSVRRKKIELVLGWFVDSHGSSILFVFTTFYWVNEPHLKEFKASAQ